jgi:hypothetical protein
MLDPLEPSRVPLFEQAKQRWVDRLLVGIVSAEKLELIDEKTVGRVMGEGDAGEEDGR